MGDRARPRDHRAQLDGSARAPGPAAARALGSARHDALPAPIVRLIRGRTQRWSPSRWRTNHATCGAAPPPAAAAAAAAAAKAWRHSTRAVDTRCAFLCASGCHLPGTPPFMRVCERQCVHFADARVGRAASAFAAGDVTVAMRDLRKRRWHRARRLPIVPSGRERRYRRRARSETGTAVRRINHRPHRFESILTSSGGSRCLGKAAWSFR